MDLAGDSDKATVWTIACWPVLPAVRDKVTPVNEQPIRQASRGLAGLLRRKGTSPAVGKSIRRAMQNLDSALVAVDGARGPWIANAVGDLRSCLALIQDSSNPADGQQLEGVAVALGQLFALLESDVATAAPTPLTPIAPTAPIPVALPEPVVSSPKHRPVVAPASPVPALDAPVETLSVRRAMAQAPGSSSVRSEAITVPLRGIVARLASLHRRRRVYVAEDQTTFAELVQLDAAIERERSALRWLLPPAAPVIDSLIDWLVANQDVAEVMVALPHFERTEAVVRLVDLLKSSDDTNDITRTADAARFANLADADVLVLRDEFTRATEGRWRAGVVPLLTDRGQLPADALAHLLADGDDQVVAAAASALAVEGPAGSAPSIVKSILATRGDQAADAVLFVAVTLGSTDALDETRRRIDAGAASEFLIDALAVAGNAADGERLIAIYRRDQERAQLALVAAGHLGSAESAAALDDLDPSSDSALVARVRRAIIGGSTSKMKRPPAARLVGGRPWSVALAMERLCASDQALFSRRWLALELGVRTGVSAVRPSDTNLPASRQAAAVAKFQAILTARRVSLPVGRWHYWGRRT